MSLTPEQWADAALDALSDNGLSAVAVEPLARRLGVTKGSFYWHFSNREALLQAALDRWEDLSNMALAHRVDAWDSPVECLRALFSSLLDVDTGSGRGVRLIHLTASSDHELIKPVLGRVTSDRLTYIAEVLTHAGLNEEEAHRRATLTYAAYVGWYQVVTAAGVMADHAGLQRMVDQMIAGVLD